MQEYQTSIGVQPRSIPLGQLDRKQATEILALPECSPMFQTYYEKLTLSDPEAIKKLKQNLNKAKEFKLISIPSVLDVTHDMNEQTRSALRTFQKRFGLMPYDGLYTEDTARFIGKSLEQVYISNPDELTKLLRNFWQPNGVKSQENEQQLIKAMEKVGVDINNVLIPTFLRAGEFVEQRKEVAKILGLL